MVRVPSRIRLFVSMISGIIVTMMVGGSIVLSLILLVYKPVFAVSLKGRELGYANSRIAIQNQVNEYLQYGDDKNIGYILLEESPKYEFKLVKKDVKTNEAEILACIKNASEVYYRVYAVVVDDKEVCVEQTLEDAQKIVDEVNAKQKNFKKKANITVSEKYEKEFKVEDVEVAIANIFEPIKKENDKVVAVQSKPSSGTTVSAAVLASLKASTHELNFAVPFTGGVITSRYGWRNGGREYHTGLDLAASIGTPIHAAEDGVVTCAKWSGNYGYLVKIQHAGGYETYYAHCSKFNVKVGDEVKKGDIIAFVGSTGRSTGPHVHLEIRLNGKHMNPQNFL